MDEERNNLLQVINYAVNETINTWLIAPTHYFYESDVQALLYGFLRAKAIELGVWESKGKLYDGDVWSNSPIALIGTAHWVNQLGSGTLPDVVVYEPLGEGVGHEQRLSKRQLLCAIELKVTFPDPPMSWDSDFNKFFSDQYFEDDLKKLRDIVSRKKARYGVSLNFVGFPPSQHPLKCISFLKKEEIDDEGRIIHTACVLATSINPWSPLLPT